jgi:hypothetical protein
VYAHFGAQRWMKSGVSPPYLAVDLPFAAPICHEAEASELANVLLLCLLSRSIFSVWGVYLPRSGARRFNKI